jgi:DNA-binding transcriptional regulator GbsR (MarR family)
LKTEVRKISGLKIDKLTTFEKEFIECFQRFYELRGRSDTLGQVFSILFIRAGTSDKGLSQTEISSLLHKSKSSISRALDLIVEQGFCTYRLEDNENERAERKYFIKGSFKQLAISRTERSLRENTSLKKNLEQIRDDIPTSKKQKNQDLITQIDNFNNLIDMLIQTDNYSLKLLQEFYQDVQ